MKDKILTEKLSEKVKQIRYNFSQFMTCSDHLCQVFETISTNLLL